MPDRATQLTTALESADEVLLVQKELGEVRLVATGDELVRQRANLADAIAETDQEHCMDALDSLNAGSELDDEVEVIDEHIPPEEPGVQEVAQELMALEGRLQDLVYLHQDMQRVGGMSKGFALEAQKLLPGFGGIPIGYYSNAPTLTRYQVSLEGLSKGMWALIVAAIAALTALVAKVLGWFGGASSTQSKDKSPHELERAAKEKISQKVDDTKDMQSALRSATSVVNEANHVLARMDLELVNDAGEKKRCRNFEEAIDHLLIDQERYGRTLEILRNPKPLWADILFQGAYTRQIWSLKDTVRPLSQLFRSRVEVLRDVMKRDLNGGGETSAQVTNHAALKTLLSQSTKVPWKHNHATLMEVGNDLSVAELQASSDQSHADSITFDRLFYQVQEAYQMLDVGHFMQQINDLVPVIGSMHAELEKLSSAARDLSSDGTPGAVSQDIGPLLRQAIQVTSEELTSYARIVYRYQSYLSTLEHLARQAAAVGKEVVRKITVSMGKDGEEIPEAWQEIAGRVNTELRIIAKVYFSMQRAVRS